MENIGTNNLESEIAELTRQIEDKKRTLEQQNGIVHEKNILAESLAENFYPAAPVNSSSPAPVPAPSPAPSDDYLASLPPETIEVINSYIQMVPKDGIRQTINKLQLQDPFIVDAFHDALVTHLYDELKARGIIK